jgi:hypothetical protein
VDNQLVQTNTNNNQQPYQMMAIPQDPIMFLALAPFLPLILFLNVMQGMSMMPVMPRMAQPEQARTKVTSITRTGNTLDIIEKWV